MSFEDRIMLATLLFAVDKVLMICLFKALVLLSVTLFMYGGRLLSFIFSDSDLFVADFPCTVNFINNGFRFALLHYDVGKEAFYLLVELFLK